MPKNSSLTPNLEMFLIFFLMMMSTVMELNWSLIIAVTPAMKTVRVTNQPGLDAIEIVLLTKS
jgi:hypothetical protein